MNQTTPAKKGRWGLGIVALYGGFVAFTLAIVGYASFQHFDLVDRDYYARGLDHDSQIARINRVAALSEKPRYELTRETGEIVLHFPHVFQAEKVTGTLTLFRPSASSLDVTLAICLDADMAQRIPTDRLAKGLWRAKLLWTAGGQEYYHEQELVLE